MTLLGWLSLAFLLAVFVGAGAYLTLRGLAMWRTLRRLSEATTAALDEVTRTAAAIEARAGAAAGGTDRLGLANQRLSRSLAELAALRAAFNEATRPVRILTGAVSRK